MDKFNKEQIAFLNGLGLYYDFENLTDNEVDIIDKVVYEFFIKYGIDKYDEVNELGMMCESIMDVISEYY